MWLLKNYFIWDAIKYIILSWQEVLWHNMEPMMEDNKEKVRASVQATIADKSKATKESEVTDVEKKV